MLIESVIKNPANHNEDSVPVVSFALFKQVVKPTSKRPASINISKAIATLSSFLSSKKFKNNRHYFMITSIGLQIKPAKDIIRTYN
jgi:hypothetical protein